MIRIGSEQELRLAFREIERDEVELPEGLRFPLLVTDYLTWGQASGHRRFLVFGDPEKRVAYGVVFKRGQGGESPPTMCEWCHSIRGGNGVGLLTATASSKRRVGLNLCSDLSCREKASEFSQRSVRDQVRDITGRMLAFARQTLF